MLESILLLSLMLASGDFVTSPPETPNFENDGEKILLNLRLAEDAIGLANFLEDDQAVRLMESSVESKLIWARQLLASDSRWTEVNRQQQSTFREMFGDRLRNNTEILVEISRFPVAQVEKILAGWLRSALWQSGVYLEQDLDSLSQEEHRQLCEKMRSRTEYKKLEPWRMRVLLWRLRDGEALRLHRQKDEIEEKLTPFRLDLVQLEPEAVRAWRRYLELLQRLRHLSALKWGDDVEARTLRGFLRGLRYMRTVRDCCQLTGLDHRLITRLLIQESAFIHQRVSHAGAYSLAQFLDVALKDVWLFKKSIPGSQQLMEGIDSYEQLRQLVIDDPHWAVRAACLYFRRLRDEAEMRLGKVDNEVMATIMSLETFAARKVLAEESEVESQVQAGLLDQDRQGVPVPQWSGLLLDAGQALAGWVERAARHLVARQLSQELFRQRMDRLYEALGLAAYNAGMGNLRRTAERVGTAGKLAFPLQIGETRNYINEILNGREYLSNIQQKVSPFADMDFSGLVRLTERVCSRSVEPKNKIAHPDSHQSQSKMDVD